MINKSTRKITWLGSAVKLFTDTLVNQGNFKILTKLKVNNGLGRLITVEREKNGQTERITFYMKYQKEPKWKDEWID